MGEAVDEVPYEAGANVADLRKAIKKEFAHRLKDCDPADLKLRPSTELDTEPYKASTKVDRIVTASVGTSEDTPIVVTPPDGAL